MSADSHNARGIHVSPGDFDNLGRFMQARLEEERSLIERFGPGFATTSRAFTLKAAEEKVIQEWLEGLKPEISAIDAQNLSFN